MKIRKGPLWRWHASLKVRLMLLISALIGVLCLAAGSYIVRRAQSDIRGEVYSATDLIENYLDAQLKVARDRWVEDPSAVPTLRLERLRDVRHVEVYLYNAVGTLIETSAGQRSRGDSAPAWFAHMVQWSFIPIPDARRFVSFGNHAMGMLVIHPDPAYEIDEIWYVARGLLGLLVAFTLLVNAFVWWAVGRALKPLERVRTGIRDLTAGHLQARLPPFELAELSGLSGEFNAMAGALETQTLENLRLNRQLIKVQEEERAFLARELHDEIGQCVAAIHADAFTIRRSAGPDAVTQESATAIIAITAQMKNLVRGMLQRLRPAVIDRLGLEPALRDLQAAFTQRNPDTSCVLDVDPAAGELKGDAAMAVYRAIQESLANVAQHAHASQVLIEVRPDGDQLTVKVTDDGRGFDPRNGTDGFGLIGMRERIAGLGGNLTIESEPGRGTTITMELPWPIRN